MRSPGFSFQSQRGSVILVAMGFTAILAIATAGFLTASYRSVQFSNRAFNSMRSIQFAEMGMEEALWSLKNNNWSDWTIKDSTATRTITGFTYPDGCSGEIHLRLQGYNTTSVSFVVEGQVTLADGSTVKKQLVATASQAPLFTNAIFSTFTTTFDFGGTIDSYRSADGPYSPGTAGFSAIVAGSSVNSATAASVIVNQAHIQGYVAYAGAAPIFNSNGSLQGPTTTTRIDPIRFSNSPWQNLADIKPVTGGSILPDGWFTVGTPGATAPAVYYAQNLNLEGGKIMIVDGPVIVDVAGQLRIDGSGAKIIVTPNGSLEIHFAGALSVGGAGIENQTLDPKKVALLSTASSDDFSAHVFSSMTPFYGVMYMPTANLTISGGVDIYGAVVAQSLRFSDNNNPQLHYDTSLRSPTTAFAGLLPTFQLTNWREITDSSEMTQF